MALSLLSEHMLALSFSSLLATNRPTAPVIRARLVAVGIASLASCTAVHYLIAPSGHFWNAATLPGTLKVLGITFPSSIYSSLQTPLLFLGPLFAFSLQKVVLPADERHQRPIFHGLFSWTWFRNYVWAPLTEEIVFRSCVLAVYSMSGAATWKMIAFAPLAFGLAHVHHGIDVYKRFGLKRAVITALFQTAYTTLFGAHASILFLRTGSLVSPLTAHIFCNTMGLPDIAGELGRLPKHKTSIIAAYLLGIGLFAYTYLPWTVSTV
ncbi:hypothetical protein C8F01DRAFT_1166898 [Mycena amicta]|nr:hypothetical protein C8F01DRAFT_1172817 [Mycena amicta]KAJ7053628.1 hypothetical protein C8F01DRAFT_1166898 [Mycena amicta]